MLFIMLFMNGFAAVADPTRRSILRMLCSRPRSAGQIGARFHISAPAISQHLKILRQARMIQVQAVAQRRIYRLDPNGFRRIDSWLARYRYFWTVKLDSLEAALRSEPSPKPRRSRERSLGGAKFNSAATRGRRSKKR